MTGRSTLTERTTDQERKRDMVLRRWQREILNHYILSLVLAHQLRQTQTESILYDQIRDLPDLVTHLILDYLRGKVERGCRIAYDPVSPILVRRIWRHKCDDQGISSFLAARQDAIFRYGRGKLWLRAGSNVGCLAVYVGCARRHHPASECFQSLMYYRTFFSIVQLEQ